jgi:hypothetical protein
MTPGSPRHRVDRRDSEIPAQDLIACPEASATVELDGFDTGVGPEHEDDCGNVGPVEITERFPPALGNLAQNARFPHFHSRFRLTGRKEQTKENSHE